MKMRRKDGKPTQAAIRLWKRCGFSYYCLDGYIRLHRTQEVVGRVVPCGPTFNVFFHREWWAFWGKSELPMAGPFRWDAEAIDAVTDRFIREYGDPFIADAAAL
jgi:hypothetical protein